VKFYGFYQIRFNGLQNNLFFTAIPKLEMNLNLVIYGDGVLWRQRLMYNQNLTPTPTGTDKK